jgi:hypothetical protein
VTEPIATQPARGRPTVIALYLAQFHPMPENEAWWGPGFTEWRNVVSARPLFQGHYQPRLPRDFGFYDLRVPEVREAQARAALASGIDAFCYYHYWFEGHRPMRRVLDDVLDHGVPRIPFCLAWANENWSRHWDATTHEILLEQRYSREDDEAHGAFLMRAMQHPLYLRVDGRPVLFIYRLQSLPNPVGTLERWREMWRAGGLGEVNVVKFETHGNTGAPSAFGADTAATFLPHTVHRLVAPTVIPDAQPGNAIWLYGDVARTYLNDPPPAWTRYECVFPSWDNTPRRGDGRSIVIHGSTPEQYEEWLCRVYRRTPRNGLLVINAWNEWAEGAYLEPDLRYGRAYLDATARALGRTPAELPSLYVLGEDAHQTLSRETLSELYLDAFENQVRLQRRLSRLEGTFQRQLDAATREAKDEASRMRDAALELAEEVERLQKELAKRDGRETSRS